MIFRWETKKEKILRGVKISMRNKLEAMRLMNELRDTVLSNSQKSAVKKYRENGG